MSKEKRYCRVCGVELTEDSVARTDDELCWECETDGVIEESLEE
jgi:hypothetical protein